VQRLRPLFGRRRPELDCDNPVPWVCSRGCRRYGSCGDRRASRCKPCAQRHRRRVRAVALSGATVAGERSYFLTLTPTGDRVHCKRRGCDLAPVCGHELCPCTAQDGPDLADWNASHGKRWNHFITLLRRVAPDLQFMRGCEVQDGKRRSDRRGRLGLHDHAILRTRHALDEKLVRRLAIQAGYGHSIKLDDMQPGSHREAAYVSKYISKSADARWHVPWRADVVDVETGEVSRRLVKARYRTWSASRSWGVTMAQVRAEAAVRAAAIVDESDDAERSALLLLATELGAVSIDSAESPPLPS